MNVNSEEDYYASPAGMKKLKEIPWKDVIGIRNHIAHGYFDIDGGIVFDTVKNELDSLEDATDFFLKRLNSID